MRIEGILITNGGPHSAEKWAMATANSLLPINEAVAGDRLMAAQRLQLAAAEALVAHHSAVQDFERAQLAEKGDARLEESVDLAVHVEHALATIVAVAKGTPWEAEITKPEAVEHMRSVLLSHFHTSHQIERDWHVARKQGS